MGFTASKPVTFRCSTKGNYIPCLSKIKNWHWKSTVGQQTNILTNRKYLEIFGQSFLRQSESKTIKISAFTVFIRTITVFWIIINTSTMTSVFCHNFLLPYTCFRSWALLPIIEIYYTNLHCLLQTADSCWLNSIFLFKVKKLLLTLG